MKSADNTLSPAGDQNLEPTNPADDMAIDGLLRERARGGQAGQVDQAFVSQIMARIHGEPALHVVRAAPTVRSASVARWPRRVLTMAASVAILIGVGIAGYRMLYAPAIVAVEEVRGQVQLVSRRGVTLVAAGVRLRSGVEIEGRGADAGATLIYADSSRIRIQGDVRVGLTSTGQGQRLRIDLGVIRGNFQKQEITRPFVITTPHASATVVGTELTMKISQDITRLEVTEGLVNMVRFSDRQRMDVSQGEYVEAGADRGPVIRGRLAKAMVPETSVDSHEQELKWKCSRYGDPTVFELSTRQAHSGGHSLRVEYKGGEPAGRKSPGYTILVHPLRIGKDDQFLTYRVFVESCDADTQINTMTQMDDQGAWFLGCSLLSTHPKGQWFAFTVPLRIPVKKNNNVGSAIYDTVRVTDCLFSVFGGSAVLYVDDVAVSATAPADSGKTK